MSNKVRVLVSVVAAIVLLVVGSTVAVMAKEKPSLAPEVSGKGFLPSMVGPQIGPGKSVSYLGDNMTAGLLARVAQILGIPQEDLVNAFKQARQEMRAEAFTRALDKAVEKGRLTQEQADQIKAWWEQRPDGLGPGLFPGAFGAPGFPGGHLGGGRGGQMRGGHKGRHSDNTTQDG